MEVKKVSIIGLGLIGGSLAKALGERTEVSDILAVNPDMEPINQALRDGSITGGFTEMNEHVWSSDVIFICTPVNYALQYLDAMAGKLRPGCVVTDVCSTKEVIINHVNNMADPPCFIGGHPMAGTEKSGYAASFSHLFENAYYILTPCRTTTETAMDLISGLVRAIGGMPVILDASEHDRITGSISHVPHVIASALVNLVKAMDSPDGKMHMLAAGGFKDLTRIASSSPEMWEHIISSNRKQVKKILEAYIQILSTFVKSIDLQDSKAVYDFFESARNYRDSFPSTNKKGLIEPLYEITVDVVDKPGVIGEIATLLGNRHINIKNINVSNSREFEQGCLKIAFPDSESVNAAFELLSSTGYRVYKK